MDIGSSTIVGLKQWPWSIRDSISLALGIPACAVVLVLHDSSWMVYVSATVLCVVTPLAARTVEGRLFSLIWCAGALLLRAPWLAVAAYLGRLVLRLAVLFIFSRRK